MSRGRKILFVSYPLLPVSDESAGGAEQMLWALERELARRGHETVVAAAAGSRVVGELLDSGPPASRPDMLEERIAEQNRRVLAYLEQNTVDLVHDQGGTFWQCAAQVEAPVLATLHLPRGFYAPETFTEPPGNLRFNCVSRSQARHFEDVGSIAGVVRNGIPCERFPFTDCKGEYLVWLGRICEEKGPHLALDVARAARLPIILAGQVYPFRYHQEFFRREVQPRLAAMGGQVKWIEAPSAAQKLQILRNARAVLVTSLVEETSSLVAMEAMACGTPVAAFRRGALPEVIADGETGALVENFEEFPDALERAWSMDPRACRERVVRHFSCDRMAGDYERLYDKLAAGEAPASESAA